MTFGRVGKSLFAVGLVAAALALVPSGDARADCTFGQCAPEIGPSCSRNSECAAPLICARGRCRTQCVQDRDCGCPNLPGVQNLFTCVQESGVGIGSCVLKDLSPATPKAACVNAFDCDSRSCVQGRCR